jgi:hypothetical protein
MHLPRNHAFFKMAISAHNVGIIHKNADEPSKIDRHNKIEDDGTRIVSRLDKKPNPNRQDLQLCLQPGLHLQG